MKKTLLSIALALIISGCASTESNNTTKDIELNKKETETQELFYNAFVGNIMEKSGQNNNAITHYEDILSKQYDQTYFNKLFGLYLYKNDHISILNLVKNTDSKYIYKNHFSLSVIYEIENNNYDQAIKNYKKLIADKQALTANKTFTQINVMNNQIELFSVFYGQNEDASELFFKELKSEDKSLYFLTYNLFEVRNQKEISIEIKSDMLVKYEKAIFNIHNYYFTESEKDLISLLENPLLSVPEKNELIDHHYSLLSKNEDYDSVQSLSKKLDNKNISLTPKANLANFLSYYERFENTDALYLLDKYRDSFNEDFYFYKKGVLNYRLGYKKAAKRYFKNIENNKILQSEIYLYLDVFGEEKINTLDNLDDIQKETLRFGFFIQKNNKLKSKEILDNLKEMIDETGTNDIYEQILKDLNYLYNQNYNPKLMVEDSKKDYEDNGTLNTANSYLYALILTNADTQIMDDVYSYYSENFEDNRAYVDTKAMYLLAKGEINKALELYKEHKMLYTNDLDIQQNILKVYQAKKDLKNIEKHKKIIKSLKLK
tara:strand:- start:12113 stop:13750 length:1638 start_codon:yes stop_codon:yes gene_type:complete